MQTRTDFILNRVEPVLRRLLTPHEVTGFVMLMLGFATAERPSALMASSIAPFTAGAVTAYGAGGLLALYGLYFILRRPRPTAGWTFFATWPLMAYALLAWRLSTLEPSVSLVLAVLTTAPVLYAMSFVLVLARRESAPDDR